MKWNDEMEDWVLTRWSILCMLVCSL